ncbi:GntR family transcriptional regulator [Acetomicrobium hydrogeniformans]|jgi:DNA-binding GntR family transcriptional regulator|uniref:Transcriptional regulator, GntR family n=1 Tax=Acetomicrobium hydrogeniformans ATCC BAA-1850 TaxID=592015 RepID=A0A0T5XEN3_9BACT|nr:GntR family transcriptional regulator [Acetomicrobium hydrogeniformans]KRT36398.1 transcriptional regulator, GntR family [Acetomicrobium hydrogeniformans ATCC BAA-1850]
MENRNFTHESLSQKVAEFLREEILWSGKYHKGQHVEESEIAERLNISRAPVREALRELENQGLLIYVPRKGTFIPNFDHDDMMEILDIRYMIESRVFEILIKKDMLTEEDFSNLRKIVDDMVASARSDEPMEKKISAFSEYDITFHKYLWETSGRKWSNRILRDLYYQLRLAMMQDLIMEQDIELSAVMHYDIIDSLKHKDLDRAKKMLVKHILSLNREYSDNIS